MAQDASSNIVFYLCIDQSRLNDLAAIRQWNNLKVAFEGSTVWVKDLNYAQAYSAEVKCIPFKAMYEEKPGKLHKPGHLLPERNIPNLLWTNIERALPVKLPALNHNYFGISEQVDVRLCACETEYTAEAMVVSLRNLGQYLESAPAIRVKHLHWTILNNDKALVTGKPILPLNANIYWQNGQSLIPAGYNFEIPLLAPHLGSRIGTGSSHLILWNNDATYTLIDRDDLQPLTLSSFRKSASIHPLHIS